MNVIVILENKPTLANEKKLRKQRKVKYILST